MVGYSKGFAPLVMRYSSNQPVILGTENIWNNSPFNNEHFCGLLGIRWVEGKPPIGFSEPPSALGESVWSASAKRKWATLLPMVIKFFTYLDQQYAIDFTNGVVTLELFQLTYRQAPCRPEWEWMWNETVVRNRGLGGWLDQTMEDLGCDGAAGYRRWQKTEKKRLGDKFRESSINRTSSFDPVWLPASGRLTQLMFGQSMTDEDGNVDNDYIQLARALCYNPYQASLNRTFRAIHGLQTAEQGLEAAYKDVTERLTIARIRTLVSYHRTITAAHRATGINVVEDENSWRTKIQELFVQFGAQITNGRVVKITATSAKAHMVGWDELCENVKAFLNNLHGRMAAEIVADDMPIDKDVEDPDGVPQNFAFDLGRDAGVAEQYQPLHVHTWYWDAAYLHWPSLDEDRDSDDPEDVKEVLADVLAITGNPESELTLDDPIPVRAATGYSYYQRHRHPRFWLWREVLWRVVLLSNIAWQVLGTNSSDIDNPPYLSTLYSHILQRLATARCHFEPSRELDRCYALGAIEQTFELAFIICKVGTLSGIIHVMQHAAPVFCRACPDSAENLVNLPSLLITIDISLHSCATHDILLSMLTHRPMFFRYDVNYPPHLSDTSFSTDDGSGLRWLYGVPGWLMVILAQVNTLLGGYGSCLDPTVATGLEEEIRSKRTIVAAGVDPSLSMGRIVVQERWRLAALIYLFMVRVLFRYFRAEADGGLGAMRCDADSKDARVTEVHAKFMKLYTEVEARRAPDSFLVLPMLILGLPAPVKERKLICERKLDLMECSRPNAFGNEAVRILNDIWARADKRGS
ncbi:fungal-specific transcription factor domain protein, partial [Rhizoctonia solani AG-3 Rhs1AP]